MWLQRPAGCGQQPLVVVDQGDEIELAFSHSGILW